MLSGDKPANAQQKSFVRNAVYGPQEGLDEVRQFYERITTDLVHQQSHKLRQQYQLDAVRE